MASSQPADVVVFWYNLSVCVTTKISPLCAVIMQPSLQIYSWTLKLMHHLYYSTEALMLLARIGFSVIWSYCQSFSATGAATQTNKLTGAECSQLVSAVNILTLAKSKAKAL